MLVEKSTAERIVDVAEELFAQQGFDGTSLAVIADRVGIRQPGIYNHFASKKDLYVAVMARLLDPWLEELGKLPADAFSPDKGLPYYVQLMSYNVRNPNLARLIQQAVLAGGWQLELLVSRWYRPLFERVEELREPNKELWRYPAEMRHWVFMGHSSMMLGYVTLAPLYRELLGFDPLSDEAVAKQNEFLLYVFRGLLKLD